MRLPELQARLKALGVNVPNRTLQSWAQTGLIAASEREKRRRGRPPKGKGKLPGKFPGPRNIRPVEAVYEAAACWAVKNLTNLKPEHSEIMRLKLLTYEFFKNVYAVDWWQDYASSHDIDPLFRNIYRCIRKGGCPLEDTERIKVKYHVMTKFNCRKNDKVEYFYPVIGVELEKIDNDCDVLTWDYVEPWEYHDPDTGKRYQTIRDENGCTKFVKQPPPGERFLPYKIMKSS